MNLISLKGSEYDQFKGKMSLISLNRKNEFVQFKGK